MKHLIIGGGNLGLDLLGEARRRGHEAILLTKSRGFDCEKMVDLIGAVAKTDYDVLWYCVGGTKVGKAIGSYASSTRINVTMPLVVARVAPRSARLVFFSGEVCADESAPDRPERSNAAPVGHFAQIKLAAEEHILRTERPFTTIVRVGPLYGARKPAETFPGRVLGAFGFNRDSSLEFPANLVTPTPSLWVAAVLIERLQAEVAGPSAKRLAALGPHALPSVEIVHCAPRGNVSVRDWAVLTLQGLREAHAFAPRQYFDLERPAFAALGCSFATAPHWHALWRVYFRQALFTPTELRHLLPGEQTAPPSGGEGPAS